MEVQVNGYAVHVERNGKVAPEEVSFTPPAGVDVIGTPKK